MALQFNCPSCHAPMLVRFLAPGEMAKCRHCGGLVMVPKDASEVDLDTDFPPTSNLHADFFGRQFERTVQTVSPDGPAPEPLTPDEEAELAVARKMIRHATRAAIVVAILSTIVLLAGWLGGVGQLSQVSDPAGFIDIVFILVLAYGLHRGSRYAAVMLVFFYLFSVFYAALSLTTGATSIGGRVLAILVFSTFFVRGAIGAFRAHRLRKKSGAPPKRLSRWAVIPANIVLWSVLALASLGLLTEVGVLPADHVVRGDELSGHIRSTLEEWGILEGGEVVTYFYSDGTFSVLDDGNFFTPERVVSYTEDDGEVWMSQARYEEISAIDVVGYPAKAGEGKAVVQITRFDGEQFRLWTPTSAHQDSIFFSAMFDFWEQKKPAADRPAL